ncbi:MAG: hypothetical protein WED09_09180 [Homoserinimonas sp.]
MDHDLSAAEAAETLSMRHNARASVAAASAHYAIWSVGMATASSLYVFALGLLPADRVQPIVATTVAFVAWVALPTVWLIPTVKVSPLGFSKQFGLATGAWGAVFGIAVAFGLAFELGPWFLWPMAAAVAVPLLVGAHLQLRDADRG